MAGSTWAFGSTVQAFDLMLADGTIQRCPTENAELFGLVIGVMGSGIILDVWLMWFPRSYGPP